MALILRALLVLSLLLAQAPWRPALPFPERRAVVARVESATERLAPIARGRPRSPAPAPRPEPPRVLDGPRAAFVTFTRLRC